METRDTETAMIHETAIIDPRAALGSNVRVGPYTCIGADVCIGDSCSIGPHVTILPYTTMGDECDVHAGAVLGDVPQDLGFEPCRSEVRIGARCKIREGVTVHRGTKPDTATEVGDECFLMAFSHVAHNVRLGRRVIVVNGALLAGYVQVGDAAFISGNCAVHQFVRIGRLAMLGGNCGVSKDVPPFCTVHPVDLNVVVGLNVVGLRRGGLTPDERREIRKAYGILYGAGLNVSEACLRMRSTFGAGPALELCAFVEESKRGICGARRRGTSDAGGDA